MKLGRLPVRYLGVPLISGKLSHADCHPLIEKITSRVTSWTAKSLTFAGRLQLTELVINSMVHYWMAVFILPKRIIKAVESICISYLWRGGLQHIHVAKVNRKQICLPRTEGGLELKDLSLWNKAAIARVT